MSFEFSTASRILFGAGRVREVAPAAKQLGSRVLIVTGRSLERANFLSDQLRAQGLECFALRTETEPTVDSVHTGVEYASEEHCDVVIGFGGGSAIDAAKAIAALLANHHDPLEYLEVVGRGRQIENPSVPFIAVPTTAGTGAEVTKNAVISYAPEHVKASLRSPFLLARLAVVDPELTFDLPPHTTAYSGLDALTQLMEAYVSVRANPMTDGFCLEGLPRVARSLVRVFQDGQDPNARADMSLASLLSGLALANAGLGAVHGFASPIGGAFDAPHGAICAALLPHATATNVRALRSRAPNGEYLQRYRSVARILTNDDRAEPEQLCEWLSETCQLLKIPKLAAYGIDAAHRKMLVENAKRASSMKGNPIALTDEELSGILEAAT
jgi:alcohol dehydrogenase class IV